METMTEEQIVTKAAEQFCKSMELLIEGKRRLTEARGMPVSAEAQAQISAGNDMIAQAKRGVKIALHQFNASHEDVLLGGVYPGAKASPDWRLVNLATTACGKCGESLQLLCKVVNGPPGFVICWSCREIQEIGVGRVKLES